MAERVVTNPSYGGGGKGAADAEYASVEEIAADYAKMSVRELKQLLTERGVDPSGCVEKSELVQLAAGTLTQTDLPGGIRNDDSFLTELLGAGPGMAAAFELKVREFSVKELKQHLRTRKIDCSGCVEKEDFVQLALKGLEDTKPVKDLGDHEVSEHLLEA